MTKALIYSDKPTASAILQSLRRHNPKTIYDLMPVPRGWCIAWGGEIAKESTDLEVVVLNLHLIGTQASMITVEYDGEEIAFRKSSIIDHEYVHGHWPGLVPKEDWRIKITATTKWAKSRGLLNAATERRN